MAEVDEPQFTTLAERIAALNRQKNFQAPPPTTGKRAPPPPPAPLRTATEPVVSDVSAQKSPLVPPRPGRSVKSDAPPLPRRNTEQVNGNGNGNANGNGNGYSVNGNGPRTLAPPPTPSRSGAPPLPSRNPHKEIAPAPELPLRRPSGQLIPGRRNSNSSDISHVSTVSNLSLGENQRRLPPPLEQAKLPPLPPTRRELEAAKKDAEEEAAARSPCLPPRASRIAEPPTPSLPPRLPSRPGKSPTSAQPDGRSPALPARRLPPPPSSYRSPYENGFGSNRKPSDGVPPPVPISSRPSWNQIDAVASRVAPSTAAATRPTPAPASASSCLVCRDFSEPDRVAAQYPVANLPRQNVIGYLAHMLCDPFPSATDKARAIFTWCHHNIAYDCESFFGGNVRYMAPEDAIFGQKAVCSGYAGVYEAIGKRAGLEVIVISGYGKGYGIKPLEPGQPAPPREKSNHAWNAVRIDGGQWKVIDACWGAGNVTGTSYEKAFKPEMFYLSNIDIGEAHYPDDSAHLFREDGRIPTWEEYILGPCDGPPVNFNGEDEGLNKFTSTPRGRRILVYSGPEIVQFRFSKVCPHWTPERHGKGKQMLFVLSIHGLDGRKDDIVPLDYDGFWWSADVPARDLGTPGQKIMLCGFTTVADKDARGLTKEEWLRMKGKVGYAMAGFAEWELV